MSLGLSATVRLGTLKSGALVSLPGPPIMVSAAAVNNQENSVLAHTLRANEPVTFTIRTSAENALSADYTKFEISGSTLRWTGNGTKNFEAPDDVGANNTYVVVVRATDTDLQTVDQTITVTVTDVVDETAPVFLSPDSGVAMDGEPLLHTLIANEPVVFTIRSAAQNPVSVDHIHFEISGLTLRWYDDDVMDAGLPVDANGDNVYIVVVRATDSSGNYADQTVYITVLNPYIDWDFTDPAMGEALPEGLIHSIGTVAMRVDSLGQLTYAPNNLILHSSNLQASTWDEWNLSYSLPGGVSPLGGAWNRVTSAGSVDTGMYIYNTAVGSIGTGHAFSMISLVINRSTSTIREIGCLGRGDFISVFNLDTLSWRPNLYQGGNPNTEHGHLDLGGGAILIYFKSPGNAGAQIQFDFLRTGHTQSWHNPTSGFMDIADICVEAVTYETTPREYHLTGAAAYFGHRFDYHPVTLSPRGLFVEKATTQYAWYSQDLSNAGYWVGLSRATLVLNNGIGPDGARTADKWQETATTGQHDIEEDVQAGIPAGTYTASLHVKPAGRTKLVRYFDATGDMILFQLSGNGAILDNVGGAPSGIELASNGYYRIWTNTPTPTLMVESVAPESATAIVTLDYTGDGVSGMYFWGPQVEPGTVMTSYRHTSNANVTRNADVFTFDIPASVTGLRYTFDDLSTQDVVVTPGTFGYVIPTNLNRPRIKRIQSLPLTVFTSPLDIPGLFGWYDASDIASITLSGSSVTQLADKSGRGRHITQATGANQPVYSAAIGEDSLPGISFGGTKILVHPLAGALTGVTKFAVIAVFQHSNTDNFQQFVGVSATDNTAVGVGSAIMCMSMNSGSFLYMHAGGSGPAVDVARDLNKILISRLTGTQMEFSVGGVSGTPVAYTQAFTAGGAVNFYIGASISAASGLPSILREMVVVAGEDISPFSMNGLIGYLEDKWFPAAPPAPPWTPASLPGLKGWWDVKDPATIALAGSSVTQLSDKSGAGCHLIQAVSASQPAYAAEAGAAAMPGVIFNGHKLETVAALDVQDDLPVVTVAVFEMLGGADVNNGRVVLMNYGSPDTAGNNSITIIRGGATTLYQYTDGTPGPMVPAPMNEQLFITSKITGSQLQFEVNGVVGPPVVKAFPGFNYFRHVVLGAGTAGEPSNCILRELLIVSGIDISASDRVKLDDYLEAKWTPAWSPKSIPGLACWWDLADAASVIKSGSAISQISDKSGNRYNLTQGNGACQPVYSPMAGVGGLPGAIFDGSNDFFDRSPTTWLDNSNNHTLVAVIEIFADDASGRIFAVDDGGNYDFHTPYNGMPIYFGGGQVLNYQGGITGPSVPFVAGTQLHIVSKQGDGFLNMEVNGVAGTPVANANFYGGGRRLLVGSAGGLGEYSHFILREAVWIAGTNIAADDMFKLKEYLAEKWHVWSPADIPGIYGWYDVSDAASVVRVGSAVSQLSDKSGKGRHLVQTTGGNQPTYDLTAGFAQLLPGIELPGGEKFLKYASGASLNGMTKFAAIIVAEKNAGGDQSGRLLSISPLAGYDYNLAGAAAMFMRNSFNSEFSITANGVGTYPVIYAVNRTQFLKSILTGTNLYTEANGVPTIGPSAYTAPFTAAGAEVLSLGMSHGDWSDWGGTVHELILVAGETISPENMAKIDAYLTKKWWTPNVLPGLIGWYDASDAASLTLAGSAVSQWSDKSGAGNHLVQATGSLQPVYDATGLAGKGTVQANGTDGFVKNIDYPASNPQLSVMAVATISSNPSRNEYGRLVSFHDRVGNNDQAAMGSAAVFTEGAGRSQVIATQSATGGGGGMYALTDTPMLIMAIWDGANFRFNLDEIIAPPGAIPGNAFHAAAALSVLCGVNAGAGDFWDGKLSELIVSSVAPSAADVIKARNYLINKWWPPVLSGWTPEVLPGLFGWWDLSSPSTLTIAGSAISKIADKSGNGRHLIQPTGVSQPVFSATAGVAGNKPGAIFTPAKTMYHGTTGAPMVGLDGVTKLLAVMVAEFQTGGNYNARHLVVISDGLSDYSESGCGMLCLRAGNDPSLQAGLFGGGAGPSPAPFNTPLMVKTHLSGTRQKFAVNGAGPGNYATTSAFIGAKTQRLLLNTGTAGGGDNMIVRELIISTGADISFPVLNALDNYLRAKWSL